MIILTELQELYFNKTLKKYMGMCINKPNNKYFLNDTLFNDDLRFYKIGFKSSNTGHKIKSIDFEILFKPNNAYYHAHVTVYVAMYNGNNGYYRYKVFKNQNKFKYEKQI